MVRARAARRGRVGAVAAVLVVVGLGGAVLGWLQQVHIYRGLTYCLGTEDIHQDAGPQLAVLVVALTRMAVYGVALASAAGIPLLVTRYRTAFRQVAIAAVVAVATAGALFVADYAFFNGIDFYADYHGVAETATARCPDDSPPWWPDWLTFR
ncbi:hypothetical protein Prum_091140 [Phytohabitans rumicis]|uniref:Uncharacterized protein n=1 Tax=Phytohabitans rumicis TaxID=1076125 RepID=A0A6V8LE02_9ACTN|nr:hypothetical protein Prum_091140 [Phytohabitans rumicis]